MIKKLFSILIIAIFILTFTQGYVNPNAYSLNQSSQIDNSFNYFSTQKAKVGDIDIAYKIVGNGVDSPLVLIPGTAMALDSWDPTFINEISKHHQIILFDNRVIGNTSEGVNPFSIRQFANDTAELMNTLGIEKADILGTSLGSFIAQELALQYPEKVNHLILYASNCGGNETIPSSQRVLDNFNKILQPEMIGNLSSTDAKNILAELLFPQKWITENPNYLEAMRLSNQTVSAKSVQGQATAVATWSGSCDRLSSIESPTLVIVGTDDEVTPPHNSFIIGEKIPYSWVVQLEGGGHGLMYQYPEQFAKILDTFLSATLKKSIS
jgi:pimeloyl-ACP methyl ester carboxylesterase